MYFCKCFQVAPMVLSKLMEINVECSPKIGNLCLGAKTSIPNNFETSNIVPNFNRDVICFPKGCWGCFPRVSQSMLKGPKQLQNGVSLIKTSILNIIGTPKFTPKCSANGPGSAFRGLISKSSTLYAIITFSLSLYPWTMQYIIPFINTHVWCPSNINSCEVCGNLLFWSLSICIT